MLPALQSSSRICFVVSVISVLIEEVALGERLSDDQHPYVTKLLSEPLTDLLVEQLVEKLTHHRRGAHSLILRGQGGYDPVASIILGNEEHVALVRELIRCPHDGVEAVD